MRKSGLAIACLLLVTPAAAPLVEADYIRFNLYGEITSIEDRGVYDPLPWPPPWWNVSVGTPWRGLLSIDPDLINTYPPYHWLEAQAGALNLNGGINGLSVWVRPGGQALGIAGEIVFDEYSGFDLSVPLPLGVSPTTPLPELLRSIDAFTVAEGSFYYTYQLEGSLRGVITGMEPVPEPASVVLLGSGLVGLAARAWRKRERTRR